MATSHLFTWILFFLLSSNVSSYENQCSSIVPRPLKDGNLLSHYSLLLRYGIARTDGNFSGRVRPSYLFDESDVGLAADYILETSTDGVLHVRATLSLRARDREVFYPAIPGRFLYQTRANRPVQRMPGVQRLSLDGYWSQSDGKLCMTGSSPWFSRERGYLTTLSSVLVLDLKQNSTNISSLVRGTLRISDSGAESDRSDSISILAYNHNGHNYTLLSQANKSCSGSREGRESLGLGSSRRICSVLRSFGNSFELEYESVCGLSNCNPLGTDFDFLPRFMALNLMGCSVEGKLHMYLAFSNSSIYSYQPPFIPNLTLVAEGFWDGEKNQLCVMACRILNSTVSLLDSYVRDCDIGVSLRFPAALSLKRRSRVMGEIWSARSKDDEGYFDAISFRSLDNYVNVPGLRYEYVNTTMKCNLKRDGEKLKKTCPNPAAHNSDMGFSVGWGLNGRHGVGHFLPSFLGNEYYNELYRLVSSERSRAKIPNLSQKLWNVSYQIGFDVAPNEKWREILSYGSRGYYKNRKISAEGVYNLDTGTLCMVGCRYLPQNLKNLSENVERYDCEISINVQFPPLNPSIGLRSNASMLTGSIVSTRKQSDSLYFDPLVFHSYVLYALQSEKEMKRMDFEIVMVLISLTLACIFIASQLYYVRRHPEVLSSISLIMLGILAVGLMIRLVLNFEALFSKGHSNQDVLLGSGRWREANEVIVRLITMVAFLLQFWLLQRTMSAKLADKDWLSSEGRVLKYCISLCIISILIAWPIRSSTRQVHRSLWDYIQSYAGLVLDGFLLPQILLNLFSNSQQKPLAAAFYVGMTLVRALPHAYDVYRAQDYLPRFDGSFIYAKADSDFYSAAWDIVIPCAGTVLALIIFVQQRFGGGSVLPPRFRRFAGYEQVSAIDSSSSAAAEGEVQLS